MIKSIVLDRVDSPEIHRLAAQLPHIAGDRTWVDFSDRRDGKYVALGIWNRYGEIDLIGYHSKGILSGDLLWFSILPEKIRQAV